MQNIDIGLQENPCPLGFDAHIQYPGIGNMLLHFEGTLPKDSRLVVTYRDASQAIAQQQTIQDLSPRTCKRQGHRPYPSDAVVQNHTPHGL